jgi:hypothetical protein
MMSSKSTTNFWLILVLSIFVWSPLLTPAYFFKAHDAQHSIFYLVEFVQTLRDGYLWPRWSPDFAFGYGYPLFNIYAPLAIYAAALLHLSIGLSLIASVKTIYLLSTITAGMGMYGFVRRLFGESAGLLAAIVYIYAPFHLVDIFVRSAYAEFVALSIVPFVFWAFMELITAPTSRGVALAGLSYGILALTHHTSFFTFTPFLIIYILYLIFVARSFDSLKTVLQISLPALMAGILGGCLAAIYLIPAITETKYIKVEQWTSGSYNYLDHFVYFSQLFSPMWGYGYAGIGTLDDFSYQLGIVPVVLVIFSLMGIINRQFPHKDTAIFFLISTIIIIMLMLPIATPIWQIIPLATLVQFPWRLLGVTAFTLSIVAGSLLADEGKHAGTVSTTYLLLLVTIVASFNYTLPQYTDVPDWAETPLAIIKWDRKSVTDRVGMVAVTDEQPITSPMEQQYLDNEPLQVAGIITGTGTIKTLHHGGSSDIIWVKADHPITVQFYTYDFPGWYITLDEQSIEHRHEPPYGLITVDVPAGEHTLHLQMGNTPPRTIGTIISGLALLVIIGLAFQYRPSITNDKTVD